MIALTFTMIQIKAIIEIKKILKMLYGNEKGIVRGRCLRMKKNKKTKKKIYGQFHIKTKESMSKLKFKILKFEDGKFV